MIVDSELAAAMLFLVTGIMHQPQTDLTSGFGTLIYHQE
jgi:hypothetical protein